MEITIIYTASNSKTCGHVSLIAYDGTIGLHLDYYDTYITESEYYTSKLLLPTSSIFITSFEVDKDYSSFSEALKKSDYYSPDNYSRTENNCVHAVMFALKLCGVELDIDTKNSECKHLFCCFFAPSKIITPKELFDSIMRYQYRKNTIGTLEEALEKFQRALPIEKITKSDSKTALLATVSENSLNKLFRKNIADMSDIEKKAAVYAIECLMKYYKGEINYSQVRHELKSTARNFTGAPSLLALHQAITYTLSGLVVSALAAIIYVLGQKKPSVSLICLYMFCAGVLIWMPALSILLKFGISKSLHRDFMKTAAEFQQPKLTEEKMHKKTDNTIEITISDNQASVFSLGN